jgi:hypothetical protein
MGRTLLILLLIGLLFIVVGIALHSKAFLWLGAILVSVPLIVLLMIVVGFVVLLIALIILAILILIAGGATLLITVIVLAVAIPILVLTLIGRATGKRLFVKRKS